jgi:hypothetical protein
VIRDGRPPGAVLLHHHLRAAKAWPAVLPQRLTAPAGLYPEGVMNTAPARIGIEAPPELAAPTSLTYNVSDELLATRYPLPGTTPANKSCAVPPVTTVPLPSTAAAPAVLTTGSGAVGPTGVAMPPTTAAGECTGTRFPATSDCVEIGCVVVFASFTNSVNAWSPFESQLFAVYPLSGSAAPEQASLLR